MPSYLHAKAMAATLRRELGARGVTMSLSESLELVSHQLGLADWNVLSAKIKAAAHDVSFEQQIPVIRVLTMEAAEAFYLDWLGFSVDWEHRFAEGLPLYVQISRGDLVLHLSEHHGDCSFGSTSFIRVRGISTLHAELVAKRYDGNRPAIADLAWGRQLEVIDPFTNRLRFCEQA